MSQNSVGFEIVLMGKIVAPFGIQGWVKIKTDTQEPDSLGKYKDLYLLLNGVWTKTIVEKYFAKANIFHAKLNKIADRDMAYALNGVLVGISHKELPKLEHDEYYWADLIGLNVINQERQVLGIVDSMLETGANDVIVVKQDALQRLIPFVAQYIINVDLVNQQILVDWGLDY